MMKWLPGYRLVAGWTDDEIVYNFMGLYLMFRLLNKTQKLLVKVQTRYFASRHLVWETASFARNGLQILIWQIRLIHLIHLIQFNFMIQS